MDIEEYVVGLALVLNLSLLTFAFHILEKVSVAFLNFGCERALERSFGLGSS